MSKNSTIMMSSANFSDTNIKIIEKEKNAVWVICTEKESGNNVPIDIFYQYEKPEGAESNYFGLFYHNKKLLITDGAFIEDLEIEGIKTSQDEIYFSRYRHDFVSVPGGFTIDGGRAYTKIGYANKDGRPETVLIIVKNGMKFIKPDLVNV